MRVPGLAFACVSILASVGSVAAKDDPPGGSETVMGVPVVPAGFADAWLGWRIVNSTQDPNGSHIAGGGAFAYSIPFGNGFAVQPEIRGETYADPGDYSPLGALLIGGHVNWRDPDRFLIGAFAAAARPFGDQIDTNAPGFYSGWGYIFGAEAQAYLGRATIYVQGGFADIRTDFDDGPEGFVRGWFAGVAARYFVNDDFMLEAEYAFGRTPCFIDGDCFPAQDAGVVHNWGLTAKFRLGDGPIPVYGLVGYHGGSYLATQDPDSGTEHVVKAGITVPLGQFGSLFHNDRHGANVTLPMVPVRGAAWAEPLD